MKKQKGITLMSLVITIIILLILAAISLSSLSGNNSLINRAGNAKESSEISKEREIVEMSIIQAMGKNRYGSLIQSELQEALNSNTNENSAKAYEYEEDLLVLFESKRAYTVNKMGQITNVDTEFKTAERKLYSQVEDTNIGSEEIKPYEINCIEDLLDLSIAVNGIKIVDGNITYVAKYNNFAGKYVRVNRNLNFKTELSYENSERTDYGDINKDGTTEKLIKELTTGKGWIPIGGYGETENENGFSGIFFGKDDVKEIKNLYIYDTETTTPKGLFGKISNCTIKDIAVNADIYCNSGHTGGIAGTSYTSTKIEILNCSYTGKLENLSTAADVGGIIGNFTTNVTEGYITDCKNYGEIKGNSNGTGHTRGTGGIVGYGSAEIRNCHNYNTVKGNVKVGGIAGNNSSGSIYNCSNESEVSGTESVGGIVGFNAKVIEKCYNKATITATGPSVGGIAGTITSGNKIYQCFNDKEATITGTIRIGGILGHLYSSNYLKVEQCYNLANVIGTGDLATAGIVGSIGGTYAKIINCYNRGNITGKSISGIGRFSAVKYRSTAKIISCYNTGTLTATSKSGVIEAGIVKNIYYLSTCGATDTIAVSKSETELKALASDLDKAFTIDDTENTVTVSDEETQGVWLTDENNKNDGYPILSWQ